MSSPANPRVIRRDSISLWWFHGLCFITVLSVGLWAWDDDRASLPRRVGTVAGVLAALVGVSRLIPRAVTLDAEGLRRGRRRWLWKDLTSVLPEQHSRWPKTGPLGALTLRFGGKKVRFGGAWPLDALVAEVLSRTPVDAELERALDRKEREHGLDFGAMGLGPHGVTLREGRKGDSWPLRDVREVSLDLRVHRSMLCVVVGEKVLQVPLAELRDPHVLAALLIRQGASGRQAPAIPFRLTPPPGAEPGQPGSWRLRGGAAVGQIALGLFMLCGGLVLSAMAIHLVGERHEAKTSHDWRPVPAEITESRTWTTRESVSSYTGRYSPPKITYRKVKHGALKFRFTLDGAEYVGTRFNVTGTPAEQAERFVVGQQVTAYVPPGDPTGAVLGRGSTYSTLEFILMTVVVAVLAAISLLFAVGCFQGAFERGGAGAASGGLVSRPKDALPPGDADVSGRAIVHRFMGPIGRREGPRESGRAIVRRVKK